MTKIQDLSTCTTVQCIMVCVTERILGVTSTAHSRILEIDSSKKSVPVDKTLVFGLYRHYTSTVSNPESGAGVNDTFADGNFLKFTWNVNKIHDLSTYTVLCNA